MCGGAPEAPDMSEQAGASRYAATLARQQQQDQLRWSKEQWERQEQLLDRVLGTQTDIMKEQWEAGKADRQRYEEVFQPIEDNLVQEFQDYDSPERRALERGRVMAGLTQTFDQQRQNAQQRLEQLGVDPSQTRSAGMDANARVALAAQQAGAANMSEKAIEQTGRALRSEAINIGKGLPSQVAMSYGQALNAGNSGVNNMNATVGSGAGHMGTAQSWGQQHMAANQQSVGIANSNFQNQLQAFDAQQAASPMNAIGDIAGTALGVSAAFGMEEGGSVPGDLAPAGPTDKVPALLAEGEYVIPADVVKWKGEEFFEKLQAKSRDDRAAIGQPKPKQGVPT